MAIETVDLFISPTDGWVEVAEDPASLVVKPGAFHPWWVAVTSGAAPSVNGAAATGTVIFSGLPVAAETVTINGQVYTFVAAAGATPDEVEIGADATATGDNLAAAINAGAGAGVVYGTGTVANAAVTAANVAGTVTLTSIQKGIAANAVTLSEAATNTAVSGATLTGGAGPLIGVPMSKDSSNRFDPFQSDIAIVGKVFVRIQTPPDSAVGSKMHFGVVRDV